MRTRKRIANSWKNWAKELLQGSFLCDEREGHCDHEMEKDGIKANIVPFPCQNTSKMTNEGQMHVFLVQWTIQQAQDLVVGVNNPSHVWFWLRRNKNMCGTTDWSVWDVQTSGRTHFGSQLHVWWQTSPQSVAPWRETLVCTRHTWCHHSAEWESFSTIAVHWHLCDQQWSKTMMLILHVQVPGGGSSTMHSLFQILSKFIDCNLVHNCATMLLIPWTNCNDGLLHVRIDFLYPAFTHGVRLPPLPANIKRHAWYEPTNNVLYNHALISTQPN